MLSVPWSQLPDAVRVAVREHTGPLREVRDVPVGSHCDLAAVLDAAGTGQFVKGLRVEAADELSAWMLRNEARVQPHLPAFAPRLLWQIETDGWHVLGFEYVEGRAADLRPGSSDLPRVADTLAELSDVLSPAPVSVRGLDERWGGEPLWPRLERAELTSWERDVFADLVELEKLAPELVAGSTLCHTDPVPDNWLVDENVTLIDWAWPAVAAPWVDTSFVAIRLVHAGHTPASAAAWADSVPAWHTATRDAVAAHAATVLGLWTARGRQHTHLGTLVPAARAWTAHLMS